MYEEGKLCGGWDGVGGLSSKVMYWHVLVEGDGKLSDANMERG